ncbi:MAG: copper chaperone PCu(A)C [Gammaproteobacteria bacterium]
MKRAHSVLVATLALLAPGPLFAGTAAADVEVHNPYVRAVPPSAPNSAAFMTLVNKGGAHAVVRAESEISKVVELHTHVKEGGMMRMRQVEKIDIPAHARTVLKPGGLHVMFLGLKQALKEGDQVRFKLVFEDGSEATITAPVKRVMAGMKMQHGGKMMKH